MEAIENIKNYFPKSLRKYFFNKNGGSIFMEDDGKRLLNMLIDIEELRMFELDRLHEKFIQFIRQYPKKDFKKNKFYESIAWHFYPIYLNDEEQNCLLVIEYCKKNNINIDIIRGIFRRTRQKISMDVFTLF